MWLEKLSLRNFKSYPDSGEIEFSRGINLLVGGNNAGKSAILKAIGLTQPPVQSVGPIVASVRHNASEAHVDLTLLEVNNNYFSAWRGNHSTIVIHLVLKGNEVQRIISVPGNQSGVAGPIFKQREPNNFIYPYLSRRKPAQFQMTVSPQSVDVVEEIFEQLPSKIDRLCNPDHPGHQTFRDMCIKTLGLKISCAPFGSGKQGGILLADSTLIPIESMGEGTINILAMLAHLSQAKGKLFLMEEIENELLRHFQWVGHGIFSFPATKYSIAFRYSVDLYPRALRLVAENRLFSPSMKAVVNPAFQWARIPSKWLSTICAAFTIGSSSS
jgi:hypothetical protein